MSHLFDDLSKRNKQDNDFVVNGTNEHGDVFDDAPEQTKLSILGVDSFDGSLWGEALATVKQEAHWEPPPEWEAGVLTVKEQVSTVRKEAQDRADAARTNERRIAGTSVTYRAVYDKVAQYAKNFEDVGNILIQADPGYAALPWAAVRFAVTLSAGESQTYHTMLESTAYASQLITQYAVIEGTYARVSSDLAKELRKILQDFYTQLLRFQISAIKYFDSDEKSLRAIKGLNPVSQQNLKDRRSSLNAVRDNVDRAIALVHVDVTKRGIEDLQQGKDAILQIQAEQLSMTRDGILALASDTGSAFRSQNAMLNDQFSRISNMWKAPLSRLRRKLEEEEEEREKANIQRIRDWLSVAEPENNFSDAKSKRHLTLGDWLLENAAFLQWKTSQKSEIFWLYGFAGTGKTGLVCRVIDFFRQETSKVNAENNGEDVSTFIKKTLQNRIEEGALLPGEMTEDLREMIEKTLTRRAQSMFLYAALLLNQLCDRSHHDDKESIISKLGELPKNITEMYSGILNEIHDERSNSVRSCRIAQETFKWLLRAQSPLPWESLLEAVSPPDRKATLDEVLRSCRTLVIKGSLSLEFAHYTIREHLNTVDQYNSSKCDVVITQRCLNILTSSFGDQGQHKNLKNAQRSLLDYALLYWPIHYEGISKRDMDKNKAPINNMLRNFLLRGRKKTDTFAHWFVQARDMANKSANNRFLTAKLRHVDATPLSPLFAACVFGHEEVIGKFGRELDGLNKCNANGQTALCLAIENSKLGVVKALLSRRFPADLNLLNVNAVAQFEDMDPKEPPDIIIYASPLQCAAAVGALNIAEYLIKQGASVNLVAGYYGSPLQAAALKGHADIVAYLLDKGAEPNSQGGFHGNALQAAAATGNHEIISLLLEHKPPALIGTPGGYYGCALMAAVASGNSDAVWTLLEEKANPNVKTKSQRTLLEDAAALGFAYSEIVSLLLDNGAETDLSPKEGKAVHILHRAAMHNMIDLAKYCLDRNCDIGLTTTDGPEYHRRFAEWPAEMSPMGFACANGHLEMVDYLLSRGASFEEKKRHSALLWIAAYQGHARIVERLIVGYKEHHTPEELKIFFKQRPHTKSNHPLMFAGASSGQPEVVRILLDHGVEYESNDLGATPLFCTATYANPDVTRVLLEYHRRGKVNICINQTADHQRTALVEAFALNRPRVARQLLDFGADYSIPDSSNASALHWSTNFENTSMVFELLQKAWEDPDRERCLKFLNLRHKTGKTAMIDAADRNRPATFNLLLERGADFTIPGNAGRTPLHWAAKRGFNSMVQSLLNKAKDVFSSDLRQFDRFINYQNKEGRTALIEAVESNNLQVIKSLLDHGADYSLAKTTLVTVLHFASLNGLTHEVIELIERSSADVNQERFMRFLNSRNDINKTALMDAVSAKKPEILKILLEHGADYSGGNNHDVTALHDGSFNGLGEIVTLLLEFASKDPDKKRFKSFLNARNDQGKTPLMDAAQNGRTSILKMLLEYGADYTLIDKGGWTALHYCSFRNHNECVKTLLEFGSIARDVGKDPSFKTFLNCQSNLNEATAVHDAASRGFIENVRLILPYDPDLELADTEQRHILHHAIARRDTDMFVAVMDHLRRKGDKELVTRLVEAKQAHGETVITGVQRIGSQRMMEALRGCGIQIEAS